MTSPRAGTSGNSPFGPRSSRRQLSATMRRSLISVAIYGFLEGFYPDAVHHVDEALGVAVAAREVTLDQLFDHVRDLGTREGRADDLAEGSAPAGPDLALVAADLDLVPLLAVLVDAEDADVAHMVVAAGIHAARDVQIELADVVQIVEIVEAALDRLGDRNGLRVRQRAEVTPGAADDVGEQAEVRRREPEWAYLAPYRDEIGLPYIGEHQVLLVRDAQLAEGIAVGELGDRVHLVGGDVAGRHAGLLQRQRDRRVARHLVRVHVPLEPG